MSIQRSLVVRWLGLVSVAVVSVLLGLGSGSALAGPAGRPDPKQMSGMPRADPQIPAGEVTVRVLRGGFDDPVLGASVQLELRSADGRSAELRVAEAGNQGRAYFRELQAYTGGQAVAIVSVDGETMRSQSIDLRADSGTAVMLVSGAPKRPGPTQDISLPGIIFDFDKTPKGALMVGVFDLKARKGLPGVDVELMLVTPEGQEVLQTSKTEAKGQVTFEGFSADLSAGSMLQVRAQLDEEGEPYRTMSFAVDPDKGRAVVLARGRMSAAGTSPQGGPHAGAQPPARDPHAPKQLTPLPSPKISKKLALGTVRVLVVDGNDEPVADHEITIVKKDFAGTEKRYVLSTDAEGIATQVDLPVVTDSLYYVGIRYDDAPYTSRFFGLDKRGGVTVAMRVWPVTADPVVARSAIQFEIIEGENDVAQVLQIYEVLVGGNKAYWPGEEPLRITGIEGAKGMVVLRGADEFLDHDEKAPFATLAHPLPPGEVAALSIGYIIDGHGGALHFDWIPPFTLVESSIVLSDALELDAPGAKPSDREMPERPGLSYVRASYELGQQGTGPVRLTVTGLRQTDKRFGRIAIGVGVVISIVMLVGVVVSPSRDPRARLVRRRDELLSALKPGADPRKHERIVAALDRIYRQLEALEAIPAAKAKTKAKTKAAAG